MYRTLNHNHRGEGGQSFVELAISLLFLLILLSAVIDLGWALYEMIAMRDAAQEGATYGAICQAYGDGTTGYYYPTVMDRIKSSATSPLDISQTDIAIEYYDSSNTKIASSNLFFTKTSDPDFGGKVKVTLTYNHKIVTPFVGSFIGNQWNYPLNVEVSDSILRVKKSDC